MLIWEETGAQFVMFVVTRMHCIECCCLIGRSARVPSCGDDLLAV